MRTTTLPHPVLVIPTLENVRTPTRMHYRTTPANQKLQRPTAGLKKSSIDGKQYLDYL